MLLFFFFALYVFVPPVLTFVLYLRERETIMKFHRDREISKFDEKVGGKWFHRTLWTDVCVYHWGLLWPCIDFLHRFAIGFAVGRIQWQETIQIHNFLITFAIELIFVFVMLKLEPFRDRVYQVIKLIIHTINITACGLSIGYVSSTESEAVNDIGMVVVWLFFSAWTLALIGVFYLGVILPLMIRYGVKCVQSEQVRGRNELQEEVAKKQQKLEQLVLGNIASQDLVVDMRSVELGTHTFLLHTYTYIHTYIHNRCEARCWRIWCGT